jgi:Zn-dependent M32 family carboxypeptidase
MNKNLSIFNSIYGFEHAFHISNNELLNNIFKYHKQINNSNDIFCDHLMYLINIKNFTINKYFEDKKSKNLNDDEILRIKNNHLQMKIAVLKKIPILLLNELEKSRIDLFFSWNKNLSKKTFPTNELKQYVKKSREYCEIIGSVFHEKTHYENLIKYNHPQLNTSNFESLLSSIMNELKTIYQKALNTSKQIKIPKVDSTILKDEQYDSIVRYIIGSLSINNDKNINDISNHISLFFDEKFGLKKYSSDFSTSLINNILTILQKKLFSLYKNDNVIINYNNQFLSQTISNFFSFYLLKSKEFLFHLLEFIKKTSIAKSKIFEEQNFFWLFNKLSNADNYKSHDEISKIFYISTQYTIERDLLNGKIDAEDVPEIWISGIRHYFNIEIKPEHILQNFNIALGKLGHCVFQGYALINSATIFEQYSTKAKNEEKYNKNYIKKFLNDINLENIDYLTTSMIEETNESKGSAYLKYANERFSLN